MATMSEAAIKGLDVRRGQRIVRVRDGEDMWLCEEPAWDAAITMLDAKEAEEEDENGGAAYGALCSAVRSPIASINGSSRGHWSPLVKAAYAAELIDADDMRAYGVEAASEYRAYDTTTEWIGPVRETGREADADAKAHNDGCAAQGGYGSAIVVVNDGGRLADLDGNAVWPPHGRSTGAARWRE